VRGGKKVDKEEGRTEMTLIRREKCGEYPG